MLINAICHFSYWQCSWVLLSLLVFFGSGSDQRTLGDIIYKFLCFWTGFTPPCSGQAWIFRMFLVSHRGLRDHTWYVLPKRKIFFQPNNTACKFPLVENHLFDFLYIQPRLYGIFNLP